MLEARLASMPSAEPVVEARSSDADGPMGTEKKKRKRFFGFGESRSQPQNTESLHMWAVSVAVDPHESSKNVWAAVLSSFVLVFAHICMLSVVQYEASFPTCSTRQVCL